MPLAKDVHTADRFADLRPETPAPAGTHRSPATWETDAETHLIRLCLDLQLDAMLLALGAAAAHARQQAANPDGPATPPWQRWVLEDVEMVCSLVTDVMGGGATLPAMLGSDLDQAVPAAAIDNLVARYESMTVLLADILPPDGSPESAPHRAHAQDALARCENRLRELRATRLDHTPPRGLSLPCSAGTLDLEQPRLAAPADPRPARRDRTGDVDRQPVPGEWLG